MSEQYKNTLDKPYQINAESEEYEAKNQSIMNEISSYIADKNRGKI